MSCSVNSRSAGVPSSWAKCEYALSGAATSHFLSQENTEATSSVVTSANTLSMRRQSPRRITVPYGSAPVNVSIIRSVPAHVRLNHDSHEVFETHRGLP